MDVLNEVTQELLALPPFSWYTFRPSKYWKRAKRSFKAMLLRISSASSNIADTLCCRSDRISEVDVEKGPEAATPAETVADPHANTAACGTSNKASSSAERLSSILLNNGKDVQSMPTSPTSPMVPSSTSAVSLSIAPSETAASTESGGHGTMAGKRRFATVVRNVMLSNRALGGYSPVSPLGGAPRKQRVNSSSGGREHEELVSAPSARVSRVASLIPALKSLQPTQLFQPHTALVRHLQFSPNGEFLATCR